MSQRRQTMITDIDDSSWLIALIDAFEQTEQCDHVACDGQTVAAVMARLRRPAIRSGSGKIASGHWRRSATVLEAHN